MTIRTSVIGRTAGRVLTVLALTLSLSSLHPSATASATVRAATRYIVFVDYYNDANHTTLVGSRTFSDCPGEQGSWGWGATTSYYTIVSEPCF